MDPLTQSECACDEPGFCARRGCIVPAIHFRRCQAGQVEMLDQLYADKRDKEIPTKLGPSTGGRIERKASEKTPRKQKERNGCRGCGKPGIVQRIKTAAQAMAEFIGDGMKTPTEEEMCVRQSICDTCPLNDKGTCNACGCVLSLKIKARLQECPAHKWHAALHPVRPLVDPICNLIMHVLPVAANTNWKWNLDQVAQRQHLFNGKRVLAMAFETTQVVKKKDLRTVTAAEVMDYSRSIGLEWTHVREFKNNAQLREVLTFPWLLETVCSVDPNELTFACHAKGVTHSESSITRTWAGRQYHVCLDDWETVKHTMERFSMAGALRRFGQFATPGNHRWHYSGTNYWFRHDDVFGSGRDWKRVDQKFFGTESWPGRMFRPEECACLYADNAGSAYEQSYWNSIERETLIWEEARK